MKNKHHTWRMAINLNNACTVSIFDAVEWLTGMEAESIDLMITEPTYEPVKKQSKTQTTIRLKSCEMAYDETDGFEDVEFFPNSRLEAFLTQTHRVLRNNRHFYLICPQESISLIKSLANVIGFSLCRTITIKMMDEDSGGINSDSFVLLFGKGAPEFNTPPILDVIRDSKYPDFHPGERDSRIFDIFIKQSTLEGELVGDPFMGAGSTGESARRLGRRYTGCDISHIASERTIRRLSDLFPSEDGGY